MTYHIAICDDDSRDAGYVSELLHQWAQLRGCAVTEERSPSTEGFLFRYEEDRSFDRLKRLRVFRGLARRMYACFVPLARRPGHVAAGEYVEVQMVHTLTGLLADVGHHPVALQAQLPAQPGDDLKNVGHHGAVAAVYLRHGARKWVGAWGAMS